MKFLDLDHNSIFSIFSYLNSSDKQSLAFAINEPNLIKEIYENHQIKIKEFNIENVDIITEDNIINKMNIIEKFYNDIMSCNWGFSYKPTLYLTKDSIIFNDRIIKNYDKKIKRYYITFMLIRETRSVFLLFCFYNKKLDIFKYDKKIDTMTEINVKFNTFIESINMKKIIINIENHDKYHIFFYDIYHGFQYNDKNNYIIKKINKDNKIHLFSQDERIVKFIDKTYTAESNNLFYCLDNRDDRFIMDIINHIYDYNKDDKILLELFNFCDTKFNYARRFVISSLDALDKLNKLIEKYKSN
jgi:hypothetical protein